MTGLANPNEQNENPESRHPQEEHLHRERTGREEHNRHAPQEDAASIIETGPEGAEPGGNEHHGEEGHGHHGRRNFWREWRAERHLHGSRPDLQAGQALSSKEMEAWRVFFHQTFGNWPEEHWIFGGRRFSPWHQGLDSFNPFVATLLSKGGGLLPLYVLHLVSQKPRYGNEIMDLLAKRTNGQWVSNPGAIYPLLTLLEREGFIRGEWEDPDKRTVRIYTITVDGKAEVDRIKIIVSPKIEETVQVLQELLSDLQGQDEQDGGESVSEPPAGPGSANKEE